MAYKTIAENCYYKTGRDGVVFEALDNIHPNLFDNNKAIDNSIFSKYSKFRFTIVDSRKSKGKGKALYYNLDPNEILLLNYLFSDGVSKVLKKRLGAYNELNGQEQVELRELVETFPELDYRRFDRLLDYSANKDATSIVLQKNILNLNSNKGNELIVKKIMFSYEEAMNSSSKFKITIEDGRAIKDVSKGNGLNIVKYGTYKMIGKTYLMLTRREFIVPIAEGAKRVVIASNAFYGKMKEHEKDFTDRKFENEDFEGKNIDIWNPQGKPRFVKEKKDERPEVKKDEETEKKVEKKCADCNAKIDDRIHDYSTKVYKRPLCFSCQKKEKEKAKNKKCSECGASIDANVFNYSTKKYGKPICLPCQKKQKAN